MSFISCSVGGIFNIYLKLIGVESECAKTLSVLNAPITLPFLCKEADHSRMAIKCSMDFCKMNIYLVSSIIIVLRVSGEQSPATYDDRRQNASVEEAVAAPGPAELLRLVAPNHPQVCV